VDRVHAFYGSHFTLVAQISSHGYLSQNHKLKSNEIHQYVLTKKSSGFKASLHVTKVSIFSVMKTNLLLSGTVLTDVTINQT
jgi:hypothetical protein